MKKWLLVVLGTVVLVCGLTAALGAWLIARYASTPKPGDGDQIAVDIPRGAGPMQVADLLAEREVVADADDFYRWLRYVERASGRLKSGELAFRDDMSPKEVLRVLLDGTPVTRKITVPEGLRIDETAGLFEKAGLADAETFERQARDPRLAASLGLSHNSLEGFLFPETYQFRKHTLPDVILRTMVQRYKTVFTDAWRRRASQIGLSEIEVVTLASIVEKETSAARERPLIAGVFYNRMKKGWKLQTDPTVIYAEILATGGFDGTVHRSDLERDHPYNTYRYKGLPPGPICSAGAAALRAALFPAATDFMYFVSKNDGTHEFCPDLACHNRWVAKYQR